MIFYFSHFLSSSHFSDSSLLNLFSFLSHALSSLPLTVRILSQDRLWVAVVLDRRGSGFRSGGRGFRSVWLWFQIGGRGLQIGRPWVSDRISGCGIPVAVEPWVFLAVGLGFDGFCSPLYPPPPSLPLPSEASLSKFFFFFFRCGVDFWMDAKYGDSELVVGLGLLLNVDGWLCWMLMGLII